MSVGLKYKTNLGMAAEPTLDLRPFGINYVLTPKSNLKDLNETMLARFSARRVHSGAEYYDIFMIDGDEYINEEQLGSGTYGVTYEASRNDKLYAVKCVRLEKKHEASDLFYFICEAIIQILLYQTAPYVPKVYKVAYDPEKKTVCMVSELMRNTLRNLLKANSQEANDIVLPDALRQVAHILEVYGETLKFNHRDLHTSNIMYVRQDDKRYYKLIDFGFSCLTWHGLHIQGNDYFKLGQCYKPDRNLAQIIYYIVTSQSVELNLSNRLKEYLRKFLKAHVGPIKSFNLVKGSRTYKMKSWHNTYTFLDRPNVKVPATTPAIVQQDMVRFLEGKPFLGYVEYNAPALPASAPSAICPEGQILNPKTGRCVLIDGRVGRTLTRKNRPLPALPAKICPEGYVVNPATGRCVLKTGRVGRTLLVKI